MYMTGLSMLKQTVCPKYKGPEWDDLLRIPSSLLRKLTRKDKTREKVTLNKSSQHLLSAFDWVKAN